MTNTSFAQKSDAEMAEKYFMLFQDFEYADTLKAKIYCDSGYYFAKKTNNPELIGRAHQYRGWRFQDRSRAKEANQEFYKVLAYMRQAGNDQGVADAYGNLGNSYLDMNDYQKSLDYQHLSLEANEEILKKKLPEKELARALEGKTYALHNIGAIYQDIRIYDKALEYEYASVTQEILSGNTIGSAISYNTLATIHKAMNRTDSAIYYFKKALAVYETEDYPDGLAATLQAYATLEKSGLSESKKKSMLKQALQIRRTLGDADGEVVALIAIVRDKIKVLPTDSLSVLLKDIYQLITKHDLSIHSEDYFRLYSQYSSRIGKYDSAYFALENFLELKAISDEKSRTHDLIARDIRHTLSTKHFNDSLKIENDFALERAEANEKINEIQNIVYLSVIGFIILITSLGIVISTNRRRKKMNLILSEKSDLIQEQKNIVDEKNRSISDSINYAKRLQTAMLPTATLVNQYLPESFLFFKPKDIVSGDFHWFELTDELIFIAAADCTGHGVPGAMVSVVCSNALNRAKNEFGLVKPNEILNKTRELVIDTIAKGKENVGDGMDIALVVIDKKKGKMFFSGANNPLWIVRKNEFIEDCGADNILKGENYSLCEFKGDKQPIGIYGELKDFKEIEITLQKDDIYYLFSDGFADQFGGENGKKFKYKPFKEELLKISNLSLDKQQRHLSNLFDTWKGNLEQVDDVCVIGFKI